ncbi:unnamed protein product [Musa banksii]
MKHESTCDQRKNYGVVPFQWRRRQSMLEEDRSMRANRRQQHTFPAAVDPQKWPLHPLPTPECTAKQIESGSGRGDTKSSWRRMLLRTHTVRPPLIKALTKSSLESTSSFF